MKLTTLLLTALLLSAGLSTAIPGELAGADQQTVVATPTPATESLRGVVDSVDERNDTITLRLSPQTRQQLKVQDGLVFNSVRFGDQVEVTVQDIAGSKTIIGLKKE
jgi:hypothetical protein